MKRYGWIGVAASVLVGTAALAAQSGSSTSQSGSQQGTITVTVSQQDSEDSGEEAIIEVADDGRGISEENLSRIFNPFFTTTSGGTGLGLPAVRRIARAHGGRVEAVSTIGQGSTFRIHLPLDGSGPI